MNEDESRTSELSVNFYLISDVTAQTTAIFTLTSVNNSNLTCEHKLAGRCHSVTYW
jgi:hypothetical protein